MKVKEVMTKEPIAYCHPETRLSSAARMMREENHGVLPVLDSNKKLVGLITDRDICIAIAEEKLPITRVSEVLPREKVRTVGADDPVETALRLMRKNKVGRLPVTDGDGKILGLVSVNNLLTDAIIKKRALGSVVSKKENLAKTLKALYERNSRKPGAKKPAGVL